MQSVRFDLPLKTSEADALAGVILQHAEGRPLTEDLRKRIGARIPALQLSSIAAFPGSLQRDPIHPSTYYLAVDTRGAQTEHLLLRLALASSPSSGLFPGAMLIGRMRTNLGHEVVVNAIRFAPTDHENIRTFAGQVDPAFLPKARGAAAAISIEHSKPENSLPPAFDAYRAILQRTGTNLASVFTTEQTNLDAILWAAIRSGWREGYAVEADLRASGALPEGCTKVSMRASAPEYNPGERWRRKLDVELVFEASHSTPEHVAAFLEVSKSQGRSIQFVRPDLEAIDQFSRLNEVVRQYGAMLSVRSTGLLTAPVLQQIGKATGGRVNYSIHQPAAGDEAGIGPILVSTAENLRG